MRKLLGLILVLIIGATCAYGQLNNPNTKGLSLSNNTSRWTTAGRPPNPTAGQFGFNITTNVMEYWDGTTWNSGTTDVNFAAFAPTGTGVCDGVADDSVAINAAIGYIRTAVKAKPHSLATVKLTGPLSRQCQILNTIDLTCNNAANPNFVNTCVYNFNVELPSITCFVNNGPCIDAFGATNVSWTRLVVWGNCSTGSIPNIGIMIGRIAPTQQAPNHHFERPNIQGCFSFTNLYALADEESLITQGYFENGMGALDAVFDGCRHFPIQSSFQTTSITQDQCVSFVGFNTDNTTFKTDNFQAGIHSLTPGPGNAIWMTQISHRIFGPGTYILSSPGAGSYGWPIIIHQQSANPTSMTEHLVIDAHIEGNLLGYVMFTGNLAALTFRGFELHESNFNGTSTGSVALLNLDTSGTVGTVYDQVGGTAHANITSMTMNDAKISLDKVSGSFTPTIFDTASNYTFNGDVVVPATSIFARPNAFSGKVCDPTNQCVSYPASLVVGKSMIFSGLPSAVAGTMAYITDGKAANCGDSACTTFGTTVTAGGGALKLFLWYNGTNWTLMGK